LGYWTGRFTFAGTGAQTLTTGLTGTPTGCRITVAGNAATTDSSTCTGTSDGTRQNCQFTYGAGSSNTQIVNFNDEAGTNLESVAWSSFTSSGGTGRVGLNVTSFVSALQHTLEVWN